MSASVLPAPFHRPPPTFQECHCAWRGGSMHTPTWSRNKDGWVDTAGLHELLRRSALPREELTRMGATRTLLLSRAPWTRAPVAATLLGRIVWDYKHGEHGAVYGSATEQRVARRLGEEVIETCFT